MLARPVEKGALASSVVEAVVEAVSSGPVNGENTAKHCATVCEASKIRVRTHSSVPIKLLLSCFTCHRSPLAPAL